MKSGDADAREGECAVADDAVKSLEDELRLAYEREVYQNEVESGTAYLQDKWQGARDRAASQQTGEAIPPTRQSINALNDVQSKLEEQLIKDGDLSLASAWENRFKAQQIAELGDSPIELDAGGNIKGVKSVKQLNAERLERGESAPAYIPIINAESVKPGDWLIKKFSLGRGGKDVHLKHNSGELIKDDLYLKDAEKALNLRAMKATSIKHHAEVVDGLVKKMGRRIEPDENGNYPISDDEVLVVPKLINRQAMQRMQVNDAAIAASGLDEAAFSDVMASTAQRLMNQNIDELGDIAAEDVYAMPKFVAQRLQDHSKMNLGKNVQTFYGKPMQMWRNMVLLGSPKWLQNNLIGSSIFLKMQGGRLSDVVRQISPKFRQALKDVIGDEAEGAVANSGFVGSTFNTHLGGIVDESGVARAAQKLGQSKVVTPFRKYGDFIKGIQGGMENAFRRAGMVKALEREAVEANIKGASRRFWTSKASMEQIARSGADENIVLRAAKEMNEFANDYTALSPFEANIIRPYLSPFYAFYKHSAKLLLTLPYKHPEVYVALANLEKVTDSMIDDETLPEWAQGNVIPDGHGGFNTVGAMNPFSAISQGVGGVSQSFNPLLKVAFEQGTGRNSFTGQPFTDANVERPYGSDKGFRIDPVTGAITPEDKTTPDILEHLLQQIPQYNLAKQQFAGGKTYDTSSLLQAIKGQAALPENLDPATGKDYNEVNVLAKWLSPFGEYTPSPSSAEYQQAQLEQVLAELLQRKALANG